jgi:hypothetical protein
MDAQYGVFLEARGQGIEVKGKGMMQTYSIRKRPVDAKVEISRIASK